MLALRIFYHNARAAFALHACISACETARRERQHPLDVTRWDIAAGRHSASYIYHQSRALALIIERDARLCRRCVRSVRIREWRPQLDAESCAERAPGVAPSPVRRQGRPPQGTSLRGWQSHAEWTLLGMIGLGVASIGGSILEQVGHVGICSYPFAAGAGALLALGISWLVSKCVSR
jgi:hypothetical protein